MIKDYRAVFLAILAAGLYAISSPFSKLLLKEVPPTLMASFLYLGAGIGSFFVLLACICWGLENNCTRKLSDKDPLQIVIIKGFGSGIGSFIVAWIMGEGTKNIPYVIMTLLLGFVAYGLSVFFYIYSQRELGAAKTSAYYAISPFIGVGLSLIIFKEIPTVSFIVALLIMIVGMYFASSEEHNHKHYHLLVTHDHSHSHDDMHHTHIHNENVVGKHTHIHIHEEFTHTHKHNPDIHHKHAH